MKRRKNKKGESSVLKECGELFADLTSIWFTPELTSDIGRIIQNYFAKRAEHYYDVDEFGMDPVLVETLRPLFQFLYHHWWRVSTQGIKNIPERGRALIVANHSGALPFDGAMINTAVYNEHPASRDVRFLVEDFVYHFPFLGTFISRTGGVRACPENAERLLSAGKLIAVFPEGIKGIGKPFKDRYKLERFGRGGYIRIAIRSESKIIPTAVIGAEETYPIVFKTTVLSKPLGIPYFPVTPTFPLLGPLGLIPLPSKWLIIFGKPIDCSRYKPSDADNDLLIHRLNEKVRNEIQKMIKAGLKKRGPVWGVC